MWSLIEERALCTKPFLFPELIYDENPEYATKQSLLEAVSHLVHAFKPLQQEVQETKEAVFELAKAVHELKTTPTKVSLELVVTAASDVGDKDVMNEVLEVVRISCIENVRKEKIIEENIQ